MNSATYQQSSKVTPELYEKDQYNRLLARGPRFRVEGEIVRDIALAASGLLNDKVGGPSVFPPAPEFLFQPPASYGAVHVEGSDRAGSLSPRALHVPPPLDAVSDAANIRRAQWRFLVRAPNAFQHAVASADDVERNGLRWNARKLWRMQTLEEGGKTDEERIDLCFSANASRANRPTDEMAELLSLMEQQKKRIADGWVNPLESPLAKMRYQQNCRKERRRRNSPLTPSFRACC